MLCLLFTAAFASGGCGKPPPPPPRRVSDQKPLAVTALGRVTPGRKVLAVAAPEGSRVWKLEVSEGRKVRRGDPLAYLDTYPLRAAERDGAKVALTEARERLEAETNYARAVLQQSRESVVAVENTVKHETTELARIASLVATRAVSEQSLDQQKYVVQNCQDQLAKAYSELATAQSALNRVASLVAVKSAEAAVAKAEAQLELSLVRAPIDGEVLKVFTYPGERTGSDPILKLGDTGDMHVIAEVYEADVGSVRVGQRAEITSPALKDPVPGTVEEVGALIGRNDAFDLDPHADRDTRIVEVRIKLDQSGAVSRLTQLEVSARIDVASGLTLAAKSAAP